MRFWSKESLWSVTIVIAVGGACWLIGRSYDDSTELARQESAVSLVQLTPTPTSTRASSRIADSYRQLPLYFEQNEGQSDHEVAFFAHAPGYALFLTQQEAVFSLTRMVQGGGNDGRISAVLRARLEGASSHATITGQGKLPGHSNYFLGSDPSQWHTDISQFASVRYDEIYPGIDLIYYGNHQQLEYDFVVRPGADPNVIQLSFQGADELRLDDSGNLILHTRAGELIQHRPVAYQIVNGQHQTVDGRFAVNGSHVSFVMGDYDRHQPLVIDPTLSFSTYLGGGKDTALNAVAVDSSGNIYVAGYSSGSSYPVQGAFQASNNGAATTASNAVISKLSPDGQTLLYSTYLGGSHSDAAVALSVDSSGSAYVAGNAASSDFPLKSAFQGSFTPAHSPFLTKLSADGASLVYSTFISGTTNPDTATALAIDSNGSAYLLGNALSTDFPTKNPFQASNSGNNPLNTTPENNLFLSKFSADGQSLVYSTYLGGAGNDRGNAIAVDSSGSAYLVGSAQSANYPLKNPIQNINRQSSTQLGMAVITKVAADGQSLVYSTYFGGTTGSVGDAGTSIAVDGNGIALVGGVTGSTDFPTVKPYTAKNPNSTQTGFLTRFAADGQSLLYSTYFGGTGTDAIRGVAFDSAGNIYFSGGTSSGNYPLTIPIQSTNKGSANGLSNAFVTELSPDGQAIFYSTFLGGSGSTGIGDSAYGIAVDSGNHVAIAGTTHSADFPTLHAYQGSTTISQADGAGFVARINPYIAPTLSISGSPTQLALGQSSTLTWSAANVNSCTASGAWSGSKALSGNETVTPSAHGTVTYTLTCTGDNGSITNSVNIAVPPAPTLTFSAKPTTIIEGDSTTLTWSTTDASSCTASGDWSGSQATKGNVTLVPAVQPRTLNYVLDCSGLGGSVHGSVSVVLQAVPITLSVSPSSINLGQSARISWSTTNALSCTASGSNYWSGSQPTSGNLNITPMLGNMSFPLTLTCNGTTSSSTKTVYLFVASDGSGTGLGGGGGAGFEVVIGAGALLLMRRRRS